jgi:hypothetical protein
MSAHQTIHGAALRLWREQQALFPGFTQRALPDTMDFASGTWARAMAEADQLAVWQTLPGYGVLRYEPRWYTPEMCRAEPVALFAFGDNFERRGSGPSSGQAIIRDEPNAVGIATKRAPSNRPGSFLADGDVGRFIDENTPAFLILANHLRDGGTVVWPADGIGTGRAALQGCAPKLWASLERARLRLEAIAGSAIRP